MFHGNWILDSEVVYLDPTTGEEKFTPSQRRCSTQYPDSYFIDQFPLKMEVFDILAADGTNVERVPYSNRKDMLWDVFAGEDSIMEYGQTIEYVPFEKDLPQAWTEVIRKDREGLIVKQTESAYEEDDRSYNWLKVKNWRFELCDVVGFTPGINSRSFFFGSLVLERKGSFRGCAGSGFNEWELRKFKDLFSDAPRTPKPYSEEQVGSAYTAAKLKTRVLVKFYQITDSNVLRFPVFTTSD